MKTKTVAAVFLAAFGLFLSTPLRAADNPALMEPVKSVYDNYLKIQAALANDSLKGVARHADAIAKAVKGDGMKMLPAQVGTQAAALATTKDLKGARAAFKPLSASLIQYLAAHHAKDAYAEFYCPMAKATWLQAGKKVANPYIGKAMSDCGVLKN